MDTWIHLRAAQFQFMDDMMKHEETDSFDEDEAEDVGLDPDAFDL